MRKLYRRNRVHPAAITFALAVGVFFHVVYRIFADCGLWAAWSNHFVFWKWALGYCS